MNDPVADDLARLREKWSNGHPVDVHALLDALEKAWGDADRVTKLLELQAEAKSEARAERDSARALLREASPWINAGGNPGAHAAAEAIRARIAKELGQ